MTENELRDEIAGVLDIAAVDGFPGPRDLDVALDAIMCAIKEYTKKGEGPHDWNDE